MSTQSSFLWKKNPPHQTFPSYPELTSAVILWKQDPCENCLLNELILVYKKFTKYLIFVIYINGLHTSVYKQFYDVSKRSIRRTLTWTFDNNLWMYTGTIEYKFYFRKDIILLWNEVGNSIKTSEPCTCA